MKEILRTEAPAVQLAAYVDDAMLLGKAEDATIAVTAVQTESEDAMPIGDEAFVTDHIANIKNILMNS